MKRIDGDVFVWLLTKKQLKRILKNPKKYGWHQKAANAEYKARYGETYKGWTWE